MPTLKVSGGILFFYGTTPRGLTLQTKNLMTTFDLGDTGSFSIPSGPHQSGEVVDISGNLAGDQTLRVGPAYYEGTKYPKLWYEGSLEFHAVPLTVPGVSALPVAVCTRFTFAGTLKAYLSNNISGGGGPAVFDVALTGGGVATAYFSASRSAGANLLVRDVLTQSYSFASSLLPEPVTTAPTGLSVV